MALEVAAAGHGGPCEVPVLMTFHVMWAFLPGHLRFTLAAMAGAHLGDALPSPEGKCSYSKFTPLLAADRHRASSQAASHSGESTRLPGKQGHRTFQIHSPFSAPRVPRAVTM